MSFPLTLVVVRASGKTETTRYEGYFGESSSDRDFFEVTRNQRDEPTRKVAYASTRYDDGSYRQRYVGDC